ncbi:integrase, catalytic region, zinc finger, CCHC-type containing protein, partial [Tanacetum coccineum]
PEFPNHVYHLNKALYGLKQALRAWYDKLSSFLIEHRFTKDADLAGCNDDCKSTSGGIQFLEDKLVSWSSKKQDCTAMSTMKADIGRCNKYVVLQSIPCSPECKIFGKILLDQPLSYALTATADVPAVYLQQFWQAVHKVPNTKDTIRFKLDTQEITYIVDMFRATLKLPVETLDNLFKKEAIQYPRFIKLMIADLMKKFPNIPQRIDEDYHSIKDDIPLVSVYTIRNVLVREMLIPDEFPTEEIHATNDFNEYETVFVGVVVPINQPQPVVSTQGTHRLEPESHKENPEYVDDDDGEEKVDETKDAKMGSLETRTEEMQTPIPTPPRSPRTILSSDKNITQELTDTIPLPTATTSKTPHSKRRISSKYSHLPAALHRMCRRQGYMIQNMEQKAIDDLIENNLKPSIVVTIIEDRDAFLHPTTTTSTKTTSSADLQQQLYLKMKRSLQDQANDPVLWEVMKQEDAPPEGEKRVKKHKASKSSKSARGSSSKHSAKDSTTYVSKQQQQQYEWDAWVEEIVIDEDEEKIHDFQLGIERYQVKVNLTAPTLTFPGIEAYEPYSIIDKPNTGFIYLNSKDEKRVMYLVEIVKFCDATLEKVLKEVKLKIFQSEPWKKPPLLGELDCDIMRAFEREITKRLSHRGQMRRWKSFVN